MYDITAFIHSNGFEYIEKSVMRLINSNPDKYRKEEELLYYGIMTSDPHMVKFALTLGANPNYKHVISIAAHNSDNIIVLSLINAGAKIIGKLRDISILHQGECYIQDKTGRSLLSLCMQNCSVQVIKKLLQNGCNPYERNNYGNDAILDAGNVDNLKFLVGYIMKDLNIDEKEVLCGSRNFHGDSILHRAVINNYIDIIKYTVNFVDINQKNNENKTPLFMVSCIEITKLLLSHGANFTVYDNKGLTPFHYLEDIQIAELFLNSGCDVNIRDTYNRTKLFLAVGNNDAMMVEFLISKKANVKTTDTQGITPLHIACFKKNYLIIELLISVGADIKAMDNDGNSCEFYLRL